MRMTASAALGDSAEARTRTAIDDGCRVRHRGRVALHGRLQHERHSRVAAVSPAHHHRLVAEPQRCRHTLRQPHAVEKRACTVDSSSSNTTSVCSV